MHQYNTAPFSQISLGTVMIWMHLAIAPLQVHAAPCVASGDTLDIVASCEVSTDLSVENVFIAGPTVDDIVVQIDSDATLTVGTEFRMANFKETKATLVVLGNGGELILQDSQFAKLIGGAGQGELRIESGATVMADDTVGVGVFDGGMGSVLVTGAGSEYHQLSGLIRLSDSSTPIPATLTIRDGGRFTGSFEVNTLQAQMTISGATSSGDFGEAASSVRGGELVVENGAQVSGNVDLLSGLMRVTSSASYTRSGQRTVVPVGTIGEASLIVEDGAIADFETAFSLNISNGVQGTGEVLVTGEGTILRSAIIWLGGVNLRDGTLTIESGGSAIATTNIGTGISTAGPAGSITTVRGPTSLLEAPVIEVGVSFNAQSRGLLRIEDNARVEGNGIIVHSGSTLQVDSSNINVDMVDLREGSTLIPGLSPGLAQFNLDPDRTNSKLILAEGASLELEIESPVAGGFDRVVVNGNADLLGEIRLMFAEGVTPDPDSQFLNFLTVTGNLLTGENFVDSLIIEGLSDPATFRSQLTFEDGELTFGTDAIFSDGYEL